MLESQENVQGLSCLLQPDDLTATACSVCAFPSQVTTFCEFLSLNLGNRRPALQAAPIAGETFPGCQARTLQTFTSASGTRDIAAQRAGIREWPHASPVCHPHPRCMITHWVALPMAFPFRSIPAPCIPCADLASICEYSRCLI